ncbi:hypothetical protein UPYG_G00211320 [Umbra pygmaea]|uniref:Uncharacterized protein n=1 Tax=Umbra pygmaea TaxID=75934 RepID=A0ABD0X3V4_UMBPY
MSGSQFKAVYVPCFGSQTPQNQRGGQQNKQYHIELSNFRGGLLDGSSTKKIKFTKCNSKLTKSKKQSCERSMLPQRMAGDRSRGGEGSQQPRRGIPGVGERASFLPCSSSTCSPLSTLSENIFTFSQRDKSSSTKRNQWSTRQDVLRTIGRMLRENRNIRERLLSLSQNSQVIR